MFRLDSRSPELAGDFRAASEAARRKAASIASEMAVSATDLESDDAEQALQLLRRGDAVGQTLVERLRRTAEALDDEYLTLDEEGGQASKWRALEVFWRARAASALALAARGGANDLHESIYEALVAMRDSEELVSALTKALRVSS